jgi:hypothetical protein
MAVTVVCDTVGKFHLQEVGPGGRANWRNGSASVVDDFVQLIQTRINDAAARPYAFTQVPIMEYGACGIDGIDLMAAPALLAGADPARLQADAGAR